MDWASAEMFAHIDKVVLENGYGCEIELVPGATMPTATSMMEKGEPDIAPELWINAVRTALDAATAEGRLHYAAEVFSDTGEEGWWIPQYLADANPEIQTVSDALARPDLFPHPEGDGGGLYTCPSGWNCQLRTGNLFKAFGGEEAGFRIIDPGSGGALAGSIAEAYEKEQGNANSDLEDFYSWMIDTDADGNMTKYFVHQYYICLMNPIIGNRL